MNDKDRIDQEASGEGSPESGDDLDAQTNEDIDALIPRLASPEKRLQPSDMKAWLKQFKVSSRSSTVTNAFVAALLPHDVYDEKTVKEAMAFLKQDAAELTCVYCGGIPTTWDHLTNLVQDGKANVSGYGHRIYNLVPCCEKCNSSKGKAAFKEWILGYQHKNGWKQGTPRVEDSRREGLVELLSNYQQKCPALSPNDKVLESKLMSMRDAILAILMEADKLVAEGRPKPKKTKSSSTRS